MGVCNSTMCYKEAKAGRGSVNNNGNNDDEKAGINHNNVYNSKTNNPAQPERKVNPHSVITELSNQTMIKHINDINGDAVKIDNCRNSTVIILDYSAQVIIQDCNNCNFFIAPCVGSVFLRKSEDIRIISASGQFRCSDVVNCQASIYSASEPAVERVKDFHIGCFFFMYTELPDLFIKAELTVWNNCWSEYNDFTPSADASLINYFNAKEDPNFIQYFLNALKDQEISVDQFFPVPFTNGISFTITPQLKHLLLFFRESFVDKNKIYELMSQEFLYNINTNLIKTVTVDKSDELVKSLQETLKRNRNDKADFFIDKNLSTSIGKTTGTNNFMRKQTCSVNQNKFVVMWLVNDYDNFGQFIKVIEDEIENCLTVGEEELGRVEDYIKKIFRNYGL